MVKLPNSGSYNKKLELGIFHRKFLAVVGWLAGGAEEDDE